MDVGKDLNRPSVFEYVQHNLSSSLKIICCLSATVLFLSAAVSLIFLEGMLMTTLAANGIFYIFISGALSFTVSQEKILVIRSMGLQIQTSYLLGQEKTNFIPQQKIVDIVINEAISMHKVSYYLAVLLKTEGEEYHNFEVKPLFTNTMPPLTVLKEVRRGCQEVLLDEVS
ncbi:phosphatidylinositol N-acetylglucosaminyltransferase subunit H-like [Apostichopus japonicus]|uniref:phosphatidylinositol N-acetylglucosaminyltransferase subunit H-like n=1 Tax=Stichopus japonicus TaxID=307972 RepID=UPI003AB5837F